MTTRPLRYAPSFGTGVFSVYFHIWGVYFASGSDGLCFCSDSKFRQRIRGL